MKSIVKFRSVAQFVAFFILVLFVSVADSNGGEKTSEKLIYPFSKKAGDAYKNLPEAKKGGTIYTRIAGNPRVLVPIITNDVDGRNVSRPLHTGLLDRDQDTNEFFPALAEKFEVTPDFKNIYVTLRKEATWDDGTPITSDDAEFTYKVLMDTKADTAPVRSNFPGLGFVKIDQQRFKFTVEKPDINTVVKICEDFRFLQKKQFEKEPDIMKSKGIFAPVSSGPYRIKSFSRDQKVELERKKDWWGWKLPQYKNIYNADNIVYRLVSDQSLAYEKFVKGEIDSYELMSEIYGTRVKGSDKDKFGSAPNSGKEMWSAFHKTSMPPQITFVAYNLKRPYFESKKTRQALAMLVDYDQITDKVYHGVAQRSVSTFGTYTQNTSEAQRAKAFKFNPQKAFSMLKEDGWNDTDGDGVLDKMINGKKVKFEFTIRYNSENPMRAKVAQMIKEQFKKAGIAVNVQALEWNAHINGIDARDFDAVVMGWAKGYVHPDPRQVWHSSSYANKGSNFGGYNNPEADKLIDEANAELNPQKRFKVMQKLGAVIYDDQPYIFVGEIAGYIGAYHSKLKAHRWFMKYDDSPALWLFSAQ